MAFSSTTSWDVRVSGSDANGGGWDSASSGADFSQQDSPQVTYVDLVIDATTNTKITSSAHPFDSTHVGNVINITSGTGFTVQRVQILSVTSNVATCDKSLGTLSSTGGNGKLGGAMAAPITAMNAAVAGNTVHVKSGTYTQTTNGVMAGNAGPLYVVGYNSTHGDGGTQPLLTTATNSISIFRCENAGSAQLLFDNIAFSSTAASRFIGLIAWAGVVQLACRNCVFDGFKNAINGDIFGDANTSFGNVVLENCEIKNSTSHGVVNAGTVYLYGTAIHGNAGSGIVAGSSNAGIPNIIIRSAIYANSGTAGLAGYNVGNAAQADSYHIFESDIYNNTGDGVLCGIASQLSLSLVNNIIYGNGGRGINLLSTAAAPAMNHCNRYGANVGGDRASFSAGVGDAVLTSSPFTSSSDLSLNSTVGGGADCKSVGFPGVAVFGTSTSLDIGAIQTTGGGGGSSTVAGLSRVFSGY